MSLTFSPNGMPLITGWEDDEELIPIPSDEAEVLRRKRILVRRMVAEKEVPETSYDDVFTCFH